MFTQTTPWITCPNPRPQAPWRLFCFPYAGGSARIYRDWGFLLSPRVEVCPVELPGHGRRMAETPLTQLDSLVQNLGELLLPLLDRPFACFGHSLGGLIAFELARWLRSHQQPEPLHLWISAARAPQLPITDPPIHTLPKAQFMAELLRYNGTPAAVLENAELMELLLPSIRADFALLETYRYQPQPPLACSMTALAGTQDPIISFDEVIPWQIHTVGAFSLHVVPGDHFFIHQPSVLRFLEAFF